MKCTIPGLDNVKNEDCKELIHCKHSMTKIKRTPCHKTYFIIMAAIYKYNTMLPY